MDTIYVIILLALLLIVLLLHGAYHYMGKHEAVVVGILEDGFLAILQDNRQLVFIDNSDKHLQQKVGDIVLVRHPFLMKLKQFKPRKGMYLYEEYIMPLGYEISAERNNLFGKIEKAFLLNQIERACWLAQSSEGKIVLHLANDQHKAGESVSFERGSLLLSKFYYV